MKKQLLSATLAAALLGAMAPAFAQNLAIVNGKPIPKSRVDALAQQMARAGRPVPPEQQNQLKDEVVAREIFMQEARKRGLDTTEDYKNQLELARQSGSSVAQQFRATRLESAVATMLHLMDRYGLIAFLLLAAGCLAFSLSDQR